MSPEWIASLDSAARGDDEVRRAAAELDVVIQQTVTGVPPDHHRHSYHVVLTPSAVGVREGPAAGPTISFTADYHTAIAISRGQLDAQSAFVEGRLRVGGDLRRLLDAQTALAGLTHVFSTPDSDTVPTTPSA